MTRFDGAEASEAFSDGWARDSSRPRRAAAPRVGRPPSGPNGEKISSYPQISARLPPETVATVRALSRALHLPQWRIIANALDAYSKLQRSR